MAIFYTDSGSFGDITVSGSAIVSGTLSFAENSGGLTGSLFGTSSWANNAQSASFIEFISIANKPELVSSSAFTSPSQGTVRITINGVETDVDTGLQSGDTPSFTGLLVDTDGLVVDAGLDRVGIGTTVPTARLTVNGDTHISGTFTTTGDVHYLGRNMPGGSEVGLRLGVGRVANGFGYIDLVTDTTYTDYGLRIIRDNTGPNAPSKFLHRGTGNIEYYSQEPADVVWITDNAGRMIIKGLGGFVGLNKTEPNARLDILGNQIISGSLIVSASQAITASNVQLNNLTDTTATNKVLVWDTATNKIFTTASVGTSGQGGLTTVIITTPSIVISPTYVAITSGAQHLQDGTYTITGVINQSPFVNHRVSGIFSWYTGSVTETNTDEIFLHRVGRTSTDKSIFIRTRQVNADTTYLEIASDTTLASTTYTFNLVKLI